MPGPENKSARLKDHRFHKHTELSAADQPVIIRSILAKGEIEVPGPFALHNFACDIPDLSLHAAAADGAHHGAIFAHQQLGAFVARNGTVDLHDSRQGALLTKLAQADYFLVNIHLASILLCAS